MADLICTLLDDRLHPEAAALSAFREMPGGKARAYTVAEASNGYDGVEHIVRVGKATGKIADPDNDAYAVLDVLNVEGDTVQSYAIPTARAFRWWYTKLRLRVDSTDGTEEEQ